MAKKVNGVDVDQLMETIELIKRQSEIARFKFRASNTWAGGTHNRATVKSFYGAGQKTTPAPRWYLRYTNHRCCSVITAAPIRLNICWLPFSGCVTTSLVAHAAAKGIEIKAVSSRLEGDIDLR